MRCPPEGKEHLECFVVPVTWLDSVERQFGDDKGANIPRDCEVIQGELTFEERRENRFVAADPLLVCKLKIAILQKECRRTLPSVLPEAKLFEVFHGLNSRTE